MGLGELLGESWMGAGQKKDQVIIRYLEFLSLPSPHSPKREEEVEMELMIDHASIKIPKEQDLRSLQVGEYTHVLGRQCTSTPQRQVFLCSGPSQTLPHVSLHLAVHLSPLSHPLII